MENVIVSSLNWPPAKRHVASLVPQCKSPRRRNTRPAVTSSSHSSSVLYATSTSVLTYDIIATLSRHLCVAPYSCFEHVEHDDEAHVTKFKCKICQLVFVARGLLCARSP